MKLKTGKQCYKFPKHSRILNVYVRGNQKYNQHIDYALQTVSQVNPTIVRGFPTAVSFNNQKIVFWPVPDKPYIVLVDYLPPTAQW